MSLTTPQNDPIVILLQDIRDEVREQGERLDVLERGSGGGGATLEERAIGIVEESEHPQSIYEVAQNSIFFLIIIGLVVVPWIQRRQGMRQDKKIDAVNRSLNGYGNHQDGSPITLAEVQKEQLRIQKENRNLLYQLARKMGVKRDDL